MVEDPENVDAVAVAILQAAGGTAGVWTWRDASGGFLRALEVEDNVMFIILSILVLIAAMNIVSGLIMLVKNKGRDIGILRTIGLSEGSVMRVFFICGAFTGVLGTICGVVLGCLFALYIDPILLVRELRYGRRRLGSVNPWYLCAASRAATGGCPVGGWPVAGAVVFCDHFSGPPCSADEPGGGAAL